MVTSIAEVMAALSEQRNKRSLVWFRGQARSGWTLVPSLARKDRHLKAEGALFKRFMQNAVPHIDRPLSHDWEWMFLMQHHRAPTRLLDWTESPLASLYFAIYEATHAKQDGAVWCLDPVALNKEANLPDFDFPSEIPAFGTDKILNNYLPSNVGESPSKLVPLAIVGPRNTARMAAQQGVFTINHRDHRPIEEIGAREHVWRWVVPASAKKPLSKELELLGINALALFPDLDRVADVAKELLK